MIKLVGYKRGNYLKTEVSTGWVSQDFEVTVTWCKKRSNPVTYKAHPVPSESGSIDFGVPNDGLAEQEMVKVIKKDIALHIGIASAQCTRLLPFIA